MGKAREFYDAALALYFAGEMGDDCYEWPFAENGVGYGVTNKGLVSRMILTEVVGPPPTPQHVVSHYICDNPPCFNPRHLKWDTQKGNVRSSADKGHYGVWLRKFTDKEIATIRAMYATGEYTQKDLAFIFDAHSRTIRRIVNYERY